MFQTKRSTKILSTGFVFILSIWLQCAILTVDSTSSSSSIIKPANVNPLININSNSSDQKQLLIESKSLINITIKPSTTKPFKFLDDFGELPELRDDDDDDNDPLFTTTIKTTTVKLSTQKTEIVKDSLSKAYPSLDKKEMQISKNVKSNTIVADVSKTKTNNSGKKENEKSVSPAEKVKETGTSTTKKQTKSSTTPKIKGTLSTSKVAGKTTAYPILDEEETLFQDPDDAQDHSTINMSPALLVGFLPSTSKEGLQLGLLKLAEPIKYPVQEKKENQIIRNAKSNISATNLLKTTKRVAGKTTAYPILDEDETLFQDPDEDDSKQEHPTRNMSPAPLAVFVQSTSKEGLQSGPLKFAGPIKNPVQEKKENTISKTSKAENAGKKESGKSVSLVPKTKETSTKKQTNLSTSKVTGKTTALPILDEEETLFQDPNEPDPSQDHSTKNKYPAPLAVFVSSTSKEGLQSGLSKLAEPIKNPAQETKENTISKNAEAKKTGKKESDKPVSSELTPTTKTTGSTTTKKQTNLSTSKVTGKTTALPILDEDETLFQDPDEADEEHSTKNSFLVRVARDVPNTSKEGLHLGLFDVAEPIGNPVQDSFDIQSLEGSGEASEPSTASTATAFSTTAVVSTSSSTTTTTKPTTSISQTTATSTRAPTTTSQTPTVSPPPIAQTKPPILDDGADFKITFGLWTEYPWNDSLGDSGNSLFRTLAEEVAMIVNAAFSGCHGFIPNSCKVLKFWHIEDKSRGKRDINSPSQEIGGPEDTNVDYNVTFLSYEIYNDPEAVTKFILNNATSYMLSANLSGTGAVYPTGMNESIQIIDEFLGDPCPGLTDSICEPCYFCIDGEKLGNDTFARANLTCNFDCDISYQRCLIVESTETYSKGKCTCKEGYMEFAGSCADETVVIGVSVGIGAALLLLLVIALVILCCKSSNKPKKLDESSSISSEMLDDPKSAVEETRLPDDERDPVQPSAPSNESITEAYQYRYERPTDDRPLTGLSLDTEHQRLEESDLPEEITQSDSFINFVPNISSVPNEDLTKEYTIARPRVASKSIDSDKGDRPNYDTSFF